MDEIRDEMRKIPLTERIEKSQDILGCLACEGSRPRISIPVRPNDENLFIYLALSDALELIISLGCHAGSDGDCNWSECPQLKNYKVICPLHKNYEEE